jgi:hypothetical protein
MTEDNAQPVAEAMKQAAKDSGLGASVRIARPSELGAHVVEA